MFQSSQTGPACVQGYSLRGGSPAFARQLNLDSQASGTFWIFSSCVDHQTKKLYLGTNRGVVETDCAALVDRDLRRNCSSKIFNTTDVCKCLAARGDLVAFAVHDLDNGEKLSSNTLVVLRRPRSEESAENGPERPETHTTQLQMNGRITGVSINENATKLTVVCQEEVVLDLGQLIGLNELKEAQTVRPVLSLVVKQIFVGEDNTLTVEDVWVYPACDYAFSGPVEACGA